MTTPRSYIIRDCLLSEPCCVQYLVKYFAIQSWFSSCVFVLFLLHPSPITAAIGTKEDSVNCAIRSSGSSSESQRSSK